MDHVDEHMPMPVEATSPHGDTPSSRRKRDREHASPTTLDRSPGAFVPNEANRDELPFVLNEANPAEPAFAPNEAIRDELPFAPNEANRVSWTPKRLLAFSAARLKDRLEERHALLRSLHPVIGPSNVLEEQGLALITDLLLELKRIEQIRFNILEFARRDAIITLLIGRLENAHALVLAMERGDQDAAATIAAALERFGITEEAIEAQAYLDGIETIDRLNRLAAQTQIRLDLQLKQIERRRPMMGAVLNPPMSTSSNLAAPSSNQEGA